MALWTEAIALAPSPVAAATRFIEPEWTSPTANTPGMLVSNGSGPRPRPAQAGPRSPSFSWTSVRMNPSSPVAIPVSQLVAGRAYYRGAGVEHNVINAHEGECVFVEIEIKPAAQPPAAGKQ